MYVGAWVAQSVNRPGYGLDIPEAK